MSRTFLLLDCHYMAHRLRHSIPGLTYADMPTGVSYGFLRDLRLLQDKFSTQDVVFCFDSTKSFREKDYAEYKHSRKEKYASYTPEELSELGAFRHQLKELRVSILPDLGYKNIFRFKGLEADDIIASCCNALKGKDEAVIVGADKDLYQLLSPRVVMYKLNLKSIYTEKDLAKEYHGIAPSQWHMVKALAGCATDDVPGIKGIGDKTAAKFLKDLLNTKSLTYQRVIEGEDIWRRNVKLTKLPYPGTPQVELVESEVTDKKWRIVTKKYGMNSLLGRL